MNQSYKATLSPYAIPPSLPKWGDLEGCSTGMVTDNLSNITAGYLYAPFGEILQEHSAVDNRIPKYAFNAKELDEENGMYYYSARYYAPPTFISRDPMFEKYPSISPYTYCGNNPVMFVDPTGKTHYQVDENGYISVMKDKQGNVLGKDDKFDMLYAKGKDNVNPIRVNNQEILSSLSESTKITKATGWCAENGTITEQFDLSTYSTKDNVDTETANEMKRVFYFLADNSSNAEWRLLKTKQNGFGIGTFHAPLDAPTDDYFGLSPQNIKWSLHSHTNTINDIEAEKSGFGSDVWSAKAYPGGFGVYFPRSRRLWNIYPDNKASYKTIGKQY